MVLHAQVCGRVGSRPINLKNPGVKAPGFSFGTPNLFVYPTQMDLRKMIAELHDEKERLDEAIVALEKLSTGINRYTRVSRIRRPVKDRSANAPSVPDTPKPPR